MYLDSYQERVFKEIKTGQLLIDYRLRFNMREKMYTADSKEACMEIGIIHVCVKIVVQIEKKKHAR